jgi:hypothetical protein
MSTKEKLVLSLLALISVSVYLAVSASNYGPGFPLDDSWIHQTYARNIVRNGEWAFLPGVPSSGATSFLWVILLAVGYLIGTDPLVWSFALGGVVLLALAFTGWQTARLLMPGNLRWPILVAIFLLFEWHLVWAAVSGMETLLFGWLATLVLARLFVPTQEKRLDGNYWWISGGLIGLASLTRPGGITLLVPFAIAGLIYSPHVRDWIRALAPMMVAFTTVFLPLLLFNFNLSGSFWPNTFYAKQAEYAVLLEQSFISRFVGELSLPLVGAGVLLVPGFLFLIYRAVKEGNWAVILAGSWAIGFLALYAMRLPVTFQHGRYAIPMMPIYFILALVGVAQWLQLTSAESWRRVGSRVWLLSIIIVQLVFWGMGARSYAQDVAFIESEMVATADWVSENIDGDALIAAHDIGALGYFAERPILDLAGLISPEVIPFIRDEDRLAQYLEEEGADYLVTFPDWYPALSGKLEMVFESREIRADDITNENMAIFVLKGP